MRPTGFEPAAYRVGVIRPSRRKPRFHAGFRYVAQNYHRFAKTVEALGAPGLPRFFQFWENSSQTVVRDKQKNGKTKYWYEVCNPQRASRNLCTTSLSSCVSQWLPAYILSIFDYNPFPLYNRRFSV